MKSHSTTYHHPRRRSFDLSKNQARYKRRTTFRRSRAQRRAIRRGGR